MSRTRKVAPQLRTTQRIRQSIDCILRFAVGIKVRANTSGDDVTDVDVQVTSGAGQQTLPIENEMP